MKVIAENRKARYDYHIFDTYEAGIALLGTEVKSLRAGRANLQDAYAMMRGGELFLIGAHIAPYERGGLYGSHDPYRTRKLLLHRHELSEIAGLVHQRGMTVVPLRISFSDAGLAKVQIAVAKGKKVYDKRRQIAERDARREVERALRMKG